MWKLKENKGVVITWADAPVAASAGPCERHTSSSGSGNAPGSASAGPGEGAVPLPCFKLTAKRSRWKTPSATYDPKLNAVMAKVNTRMRARMSGDSDPSDTEKEQQVPAESISLSRLLPEADPTGDAGRATVR